MGTVVLVHIATSCRIDPDLGGSTRCVISGEVVDFPVAVGVILGLAGDDQRLVETRWCSVWIKPNRIRRHRGHDSGLGLRHHWRKGTCRVWTWHKHRKPRSCHASIIKDRGAFSCLVEEHRCTGEDTDRRISLRETLRGTVDNMTLREVPEWRREGGIVALVEVVSTMEAGAVLTASVVMLRGGVGRWEALSVVTLVGVLAREGASVAVVVAVTTSASVYSVATVEAAAAAAVAVAVTMAIAIATPVASSPSPQAPSKLGVWGGVWGRAPAMGLVWTIVVHGFLGFPLGFLLFLLGWFVEEDVLAFSKGLSLVSREWRSWGIYLLRLRLRSHRRT